MAEKTLIGTDLYNVKLGELIEEDKPILFEWINNKELVEYNSFFRPVSWENHCKWFELIRKKHEVVIFGIRTVPENKLIGTCQLLNINDLTRSAELQIRIGYFEEMGKGLGSQAVKLLLKWGFENRNLNRIYLHVFANNVRAIKSYLKNGLSEEGHLKKAAFINGEFVDVKIMAILKEEFFK